MGKNSKLVYVEHGSNSTWNNCDFVVKVSYLFPDNADGDHSGIQFETMSMSPEVTTLSFVNIYMEVYGTLDLIDRRSVRGADTQVDFFGVQFAGLI